MWLSIAIRHRLRDWPTSLAFTLVIGAAIAVAGAWLAIASPLLTGAIPFAEPDRVVAIESIKRGQTGGVSWQDIEDIRVPSIEHIAAFSPRTWGLQTEPHGHVDVVLSLQVTPEFFQVLGLNIRADEPDTVWFSYTAAQRFRPGHTVHINAVDYRVAGVLPRAFDLPRNGQSPDIYTPLNRAEYCCQRGGGASGGVARLKPNVARTQFDSELDARSH